MTKSLKLIATTTASTLLVSLTTSCGIDEKKPVSSEEQDRHNEQNEKGKSNEEFEIKLREMKGSLDVIRCDGNCRTNGK